MIRRKSPAVSFRAAGVDPSQHQLFRRAIGSDKRKVGRGSPCDDWSSGTQHLTQTHGPYLPWVFLDLVINLEVTTETRAEARASKSLRMIE
jgi:hypothetical protein